MGEVHSFRPFAKNGGTKTWNGKKQGYVKRSPTLHINVDEDINLLKWEVKAISLKKDVYLTKAKEALHIG
jgi:hypothetical protein